MKGSRTRNLLRSEKRKKLNAPLQRLLRQFGNWKLSRLSGRRLSQQLHPPLRLLVTPPLYLSNVFNVMMKMGFPDLLLHQHPSAALWICFIAAVAISWKSFLALALRATSWRHRSRKGLEYQC